MKEPTLGHTLLRKLQTSSDVSFKLNSEIQKRWFTPEQTTWPTLNMIPLRSALMEKGHMLVSTRQSDSKDIYITCIFDETQPLCLDHRVAGYGLSEEFSVCMLAYLMNKRITRKEREQLSPGMALQIMSVMQPDFPLDQGLVNHVEVNGVHYYNVRVNANTKLENRMTVSVFRDGHMEAYSKMANGPAIHHRNLAVNIYLPVLKTMQSLIPIK